MIDPNSTANLSDEELVDALIAGQVQTESIDNDGLIEMTAEKPW